MSRYSRCKECYNTECIFVTGEREDIDTSECVDFRPMTNADRIRAMSDEELSVFLSETTSNAIVVLGIGSNGKSKNAFDWYEWLKDVIYINN